MRGKHHSYNGKEWVDLEDPTPTSDSKFGVAYVSFEDADKVDYAIAELNNTGCVSSEPPFVPILY